MFDINDYEYVTVDVPLVQNTVMSTADDGKIFIPQGKVVGIGCVAAGDTEGRIINLSVLDNNQEVIKPSDYRFSEKTSGGEFKNCLRPIDFTGGKTFEARLTALVPSASEDVTVQVLFMIQKIKY